MDMKAKTEFNGRAEFKINKAFQSLYYIMSKHFTPLISPFSFQCVEAVELIWDSN